MPSKISLKEVYQWALLMVVPFLFTSWVQYEPIRAAKIIGVGVFASVSVFAFARDVLPLPYIALVSYFLLNAVITGLGQVQIWGIYCIATALLVALPWYRASEHFYRNTLRILATAGFVMSIYAIAQMLNYDPVFIRAVKGEVIPVGFLGQQTILGPFLVCCALAALSIGQRLVAILIAVPIIFCDSSFTFLALGVGLTILLWEKLLAYWEMVAIGAATAASGALYLHPSLLTVNGRFQLWAEIFNAMSTSHTFQLLFGYGGASFFSLFHKVQSKSLFDLAGYFLEAHNDLIQQLFETGVVGVAILLICLGDLSIRAFKQRGNATVLAFAAITFSMIANSMGNFILRLEPFGVMLIIGMLCILTMRKEVQYGS